jgi:hypothetical protein
LEALDQITEKKYWMNRLNRPNHVKEIVEVGIVFYKKNSFCLSPLSKSYLFLNRKREIDIKQNELIHELFNSEGEMKEE